MNRTRRIRIAQLGFILVALAGVVVALFALDVLTAEWLIIAAFLVLLFAIELGAPSYEQPWWRTKLGWLVLGGFILYVAVLASQFD